MSDASDSATPAPAQTTSAGGLLRRARQAQGLHIAALAAAIKVAPQKLELLESDRIDQLPDATFTRALAHTVCRHLKIDAAPILALLPPLSGYRIEQVGEGLNMPFRERPGRLVPKQLASVASPVLWIAGLIMLLTLAVYAIPAHWLNFAMSSAARVSRIAAAASAAPTSMSTTNVMPAQASPESVVEKLPAPFAAGASVAITSKPALEGVGSNVLQFRATAQSWVEVTDARGQPLLSRLLEPGEDIGLDGLMPMKARIGNAKAVTVILRGQTVELATYTRDNVARLELR